MTKKYPHLCSPITLGRVTFRNRMFSAPMGGTDIKIMAGGSDEEEAVDALVALVESGFAE